MVTLSRKCPKCKKVHKVEMSAFIGKEEKENAFHVAEQELEEKIYNCDHKTK